MSLLFALAAASLASASGTLEPPALPAAQDAAPATIIAGAKACAGAVADPAGVAAHFGGWSDSIEGMSGNDIKAMKAANGRVYSRDNVRVALQPGAKGGCVVVAGIGAGFDRIAFRSALGRALGTTVSADGPASLPHGEVMSAELGERVAFILVGSPDQVRSLSQRSDP